MRYLGLLLVELDLKLEELLNDVIETRESLPLNTCYCAYSATSSSLTGLECLPPETRCRWDRYDPSSLKASVTDRLILSFLTGSMLARAMLSIRPMSSVF